MEGIVSMKATRGDIQDTLVFSFFRESGPLSVEIAFGYLGRLVFG